MRVLVFLLVTVTPLRNEVLIGAEPFRSFFRNRFGEEVRSGVAVGEKVVRPSAVATDVDRPLPVGGIAHRVVTLV